MELQLKNIGMIKEANVKIDGLTVIAGENDTGKSTVGKALYMQLVVALTDFHPREEDTFSQEDASSVVLRRQNVTLFKTNITKMGKIKLVINNSIYESNILGFDVMDSFDSFNIKNHDINFNFFPIMIESPLVWNFSDFFRDIALIESQMNIEVEYPYLMKDLNFKLFIKNATTGLDIKEEVTSLMGGQFEKDEKGSYFFNKDGQRIELVNTATGIKYFAIFQVLSQNNYLNKDTVLILDEPEVHLHPKWQLEMAKIIVELVKNGVKIVVNSHSPYMIEALERYAEKAEVPADFYLAEDGIIDKVEENNSKTLAKIFHKLSAPYETFNQMDSETLKGG